jgi:hypothetical protein
MYGILLLLLVPYIAIVIFLTVVYEKIWNFVEKNKFVRMILIKYDNLCNTIGEHVLTDVRDCPMIPYFVTLILFSPTLFFVSFFVQQYVLEKFSIFVMMFYHVLLLGPRFRNFAHVNVLIHRNFHTHNNLLKTKFNILEWWCGIFYGIVPEFYGIGHAVHHIEDNGPNDVLSTQEFDKTSFLNFVKYIDRFAFGWTNLPNIKYFYDKKQYKKCVKLICSVIVYYGIALYLFTINWKFCVGHYLIPQFFSIIFLSAVSYVWHPFNDTELYVNTVTILDGHDNLFNEDYHVIHHLYPNLHWSKVKDVYIADLEKYKKHNSPIFRDTQQIELFFMFMFKDYEKLAEKFVDLSGKMTKDDKIKLLKKRLCVLN